MRFLFFLYICVEIYCAADFNRKVSGFVRKRCQRINLDRLWSFLKDLINEWKFMSRLGLWIGLILLLYGCDSNKIKVVGEITDLQGEIKLLTVMPGSLDTVNIEGTKEGAKFKWNISGLNLPAKVWLEADDKIIADFILDPKEEIQIKGRIADDSLMILGGGLESEYAALKQFLKEKYQVPIEEIDHSISRMVSRTNRTGSDQRRLNRLITLKGHYEHYRNAYIKKLIRTNLSHELSLVLIEEELKDSLEVQKQLFQELTIKNKNSNLYKILEQKLQ